MVDTYDRKKVHEEDAVRYDGELFSSYIVANEYAIEHATKMELAAYAVENAFDSWVHSHYIGVSVYLMDTRPLMERFAKEDIEFYVWLEDYRAAHKDDKIGIAHV